MQHLHQLLLMAVMAVSTTAVDVLAATTFQTQQYTHLRGLLEKIVSNDATPAPVRELVAVWEEGKKGEPRQLRPIKKKIMGGKTVVVFNDRRLPLESKTESVLVTFDVQSSPNCVVSVCGELSKWYLGSKEQCFDLRIAPKSTDELENGLIRGISAAYSGLRPVASKLYLKFDETNYIDGSKCEYKILSGSKTVRDDEVASGAQTSMA